MTEILVLGNSYCKLTTNALWPQVLDKVSPSNTETDVDGEYRMRGVKGGEYFLFAVYSNDVSAVMWLDPLKIDKSGDVTVDLHSRKVWAIGHKDGSDETPDETPARSIPSTAATKADPGDDVPPPAELPMQIGDPPLPKAVGSGVGPVVMPPAEREEPPEKETGPSAKTLRKRKRKPLFDGPAPPIRP